jgi:hypothetical protein
VDISGRVTTPNTAPGAASQEKWRYRQAHRFDYISFAGRGNTIPQRVSRSLLGLVPLLLSLGRLQIEKSRAFQSYHRRKAERLLKRVGIELIRASRERDGDLTVATLAGQLGLHYQKPQLQEGWVYPVERVSGVVGEN